MAASEKARSGPLKRFGVTTNGDAHQFKRNTVRPAPGRTVVFQPPRLIANPAQTKAPAKLLIKKGVIIEGRVSSEERKMCVR